MTLFGNKVVDPTFGTTGTLRRRGETHRESHLMMEAEIGMMRLQGTPRNARITGGWEQTRFSPKAFRMEHGSADNLTSDV